MPFCRTLIWTANGASSMEMMKLPAGAAVGAFVAGFAVTTGVRGACVTAVDVRLLDYGVADGRYSTRVRRSGPAAIASLRFWPSMNLGRAEERADVRLTFKTLANDSSSASGGEGA